MSEKHSIHCPARDIPVRAEADVLVVGGGPAGIMAAEAAAGDGLRVMLVESRGFLGGNMTIGLPLLGFLGRKGNVVIKGLPLQFVERLQEKGLATHHRACPLHVSLTMIDPEGTKHLAFQIIKECGIDFVNLPDEPFDDMLGDSTGAGAIFGATGGVMDAADLEAIAEVLRGTNIMVLSDEIYAELTYGLDRHISIATLPGMKERTIVVNGFSKAYAMTGWRLGYAVGPEPVIKVMTKIHQSCIMSAPTTSQYAAIAALHSCDDSIEMMRDEYNRRRRYVVKALNDMGLTCFEPRGAFYVFPCIRCSGLTSQEFCEMLLKEQEVAIIPGDAFGASGEGYARISYAYSVEHLETAMRRIRTFLKDHGWLAE